MARLITTIVVDDTTVGVVLVQDNAALVIYADDAFRAGLEMHLTHGIDYPKGTSLAKYNVLGTASAYRKAVKVAELYERIFTASITLTDF